MIEYETKGIFTLDDGDISLPDRSSVTNKGDCGKLLIIGGDRGMAGAAAFAAEAAYRMGAGLVEVLTHEDNRIPMQILVPEAIVSFWDKWSIKKLNAYSAVTLGIGMGKSDTARLLLSRILPILKVPSVIDADALNIIADTPELLEHCGENTVLTPHLMEFSRLTGIGIDKIKGNTIALAQEFVRKHGTNIVLKDKNTVIALANGKTFVNTRGSSALSKGGTGDILAGMVGSLLAQGMSLESAVPQAVYLHSKAGERAGERLGERSTLARDVINELSFTIKEI